MTTGAGMIRILDNTPLCLVMTAMGLRLHGR